MDALFAPTTPRQNSLLAAQLGCETAADGVYVAVDANGLTSVPGVYAVGDMAGPAHQLVLAAAAGYWAGVALNQALIAEANAAPQAAVSQPAPTTTPPRRITRRHLQTISE